MNTVKNVFVAPLAGAWIEILSDALFCQIQQTSLLSRERGLKYIYIKSEYSRILVAPLAGAWIEILTMQELHCFS